jgi:hypothetical protein
VQKHERNLPDSVDVVGNFGGAIQMRQFIQGEIRTQSTVLPELLDD